jgi:hypothetical protein
MISKRAKLGGKNYRSRRPGFRKVRLRAFVRHLAKRTAAAASTTSTSTSKNTAKACVTVKVSVKQGTQYKKDEDTINCEVYIQHCSSCDIFFLRSQCSWSLVKQLKLVQRLLDTLERFCSGFERQGA